MRFYDGQHRYYCGGDAIPARVAKSHEYYAISCHWRARSGYHNGMTSS